MNKCSSVWWWNLLEWFCKFVADLLIHLLFVCSLSCSSPWPPLVCIQDHSRLVTSQILKNFSFFLGNVWFGGGPSQNTPDFSSSASPCLCFSQAALLWLCNLHWEDIMEQWQNWTHGPASFGLLWGIQERFFTHCCNVAVVVVAAKGGCNNNNNNNNLFYIALNIYRHRLS